MIEMPGDCATALSLRTDEVDPGVTARLLLVLPKSSFEGISTCRSAVFGVRPVMDLGDGSAGVEADHGGSGGCIDGCGASLGGSGAVTSGASSCFGSEALGLVSSGSVISTSTVGCGVGSFAGVSSLCLVSGTGSVEMSIAVGSSSGGDGGSGDGLFDDTSFRAGDLASTLTDVDRIRSRCNLSSCACCKSLRLNESGGFIWRGLMQIWDFALLSSIVCVDAST